jgi:hypothetical protein
VTIISKKRNRESLFRFTNPRSTKSIRCQTASTLAVRRPGV